MKGLTAAIACRIMELNFKHSPGFKRISVIVLSIFVLSSFCLPSSSAMDYIAGVKGGYFAWDPFIKRIGVPQFEQIDTGTGVLYGPIFSILFNQDISFSVTGLFGTQSTSWTSENFLQDSTNEPTTGTYTLDMDRIDVDSALSYRLSDNFKIFIGYKYQKSDMIMESVSYRRGPLDITARHEYIDISMPSNGPALGFGFSTPVGDRFFLAANLSALYMWGDFDFNTHQYEYVGNNPSTKSKDETYEVKTITINTRGINFEPTVGASMGEGLPIFTLGLRLQWSQTIMHDAEVISVDEKWCNDYQYGLFVAIVQPF